MKSHRYIFAVFAAFVFAGCREVTQNFNYFEEGGVGFGGGLELPFSGGEEGGEGVIGLIRAAAGKGDISLRLSKMSGLEEVKLEDGTGFGADGLVLNHSNSPSVVTINGGGRTIDLTGSNPNGSPLITVGQGVTLILEHITLKGLVREGNGQLNPFYVDHIQGGTDAVNNTAPVIQVEGGGTLILRSGAVITENEIESGNGGGVYVKGNGTLTMETGSDISGNASSKGGGVFVDGGGRFIMDGGAIHNNISGNGGSGGGVYLEGSFVMNAGEIRENTAGFFGGGVCVSGGGMFRLDGGNIIKNKGQAGGGVGVNNSSLVMDWGTISGNESRFMGSGNNDIEYTGGGGVFVTGQFTMVTGTISGNTAFDGGGGGVRTGGAPGSGQFMMNAGEIVGNVSMKGHFEDGDGGGVYMHKGGDYFQMASGAIAGNTAARHGGGVYMGGKDGPTTFSMVYGSIHGNGFGISSDDAKGGGVYVSNGGKFTKQKGAVINGLMTMYDEVHGDWIDKNFQNYFKKPVGTDADPNAFRVDFYTWTQVTNEYWMENKASDPPPPKGIGYAVYYVRGNGNVYKEDDQNRDLCRDRMVEADIEITPFPNMDEVDGWWKWEQNYPYAEKENEDEEE